MIPDGGRLASIGSGSRRIGLNQSYSLGGIAAELIDLGHRTHFRFEDKQLSNQQKGKRDAIKCHSIFVVGNDWPGHCLSLPSGCFWRSGERFRRIFGRINHNFRPAGEVARLETPPSRRADVETSQHSSAAARRSPPTSRSTAKHLRPRKAYLNNSMPRDSVLGEAECMLIRLKLITAAASRPECAPNRK